MLLFHLFLDWLTKYITEKAKILSKTSKGGLSKQAQKVKDHYLRYYILPQ